MAESIEEFAWERVPSDLDVDLGFILRRHERYISLLRDHIEKLEEFITLASGEITIRTGSASITLKKDGSIKVKGKDLKIEASGDVEIKAGKDIVMKGMKILQN